MAKEQDSIIVRLYCKLKQELCVFAAKYCPREAEDIVQDSFADIYVQREAYRDTFSFQAYLYAVIRHKASDHCLII